MTNQEQVIAEIAREVVARLRAQMQQAQPVPLPASAPASARHASSADAHDGVFLTVDEAVNAAQVAQKKVEV